MQFNSIDFTVWLILNLLLVCCSTDTSLTVYVSILGSPDVQSQPCLKAPLSWPGIPDETFQKSWNSSHVSNWRRAQWKHLEFCNVLHCLNRLLPKPAGSKTRTCCPSRKRFFPQKLTFQLCRNKTAGCEKGQLFPQPVLIVGPYHVKLGLKMFCILNMPVY